MSTAGILSSPRTLDFALPSRPSSPRPTQQRRDTTTSTRSEQMLREMLNKDGVARERSLSRSSSTVLHRGPIQLPPPLPIGGPCTGTSTRSRHARNESISDVASSRDDSEFDRPIFAGVGGLGAPSSVVYRPRPIPRNTHDGVIPSQTVSYNIPSDNTTTTNKSPSPPAPYRHASSPLISTAKHQQQHEEFEESFSPSPTSMNSSGWNSPMHQSHRTPSPSSTNSHRPSPSPTQGSTTASSSFNLELASEYCKQQRGYVSFGDIEGLGRPAGEEEDERMERERLEAELRKKKWWPASWLESSGSKTPAHED